MEEAYNELYQQFLCLRSLCLRQASLLHQLTAALQKQQGASVPNGELSDMMSIAVQCTHEIPAYPHEKPKPLTAATQNPAAQCGTNRLSRNVGTFSDLLAQDMSKLCVDMTSAKAEQTETFLLTLDSSESKNPGKDHLGRDMALCTAAVTDSPSLASDFMDQAGAPLMSDVALQSHVCEFCQAVFPGDSTTKGEFLRHLYTHVT